MRRKYLLVLCLTLMSLLSWQSYGQNTKPSTDLFADESHFLPVDQAFQFDFKQQGDKLVLSWTVADGYYLYKRQFKTVVKQAELGKPVYPKGDIHEDDYFGKSEVFRHQVSIHFPIIEASADGVVKIRYQGCAEAGLCYPPTTKVVYLDPVKKTGTGIPATATSTDNAATSPPAVTSQQGELAARLAGGQHLAYTLLLFLGLGILLAFTPCVFPMYPILSAIVLGQGKPVSTTRAFSLSMIYVQGMALTYSVLGLIVATAGVQFQATLQQPAVLIVLVVVFILLALVMFGRWELQLPSSWQEKLNNISNKQTSGSIIGVFVMGVISGLVASPCTTAPLTGILLFIAQSGDLLLGFTALYVLSLGMGIPLVLFAVTSGKLLPKAGNWMNIVKTTFGFMMLVVALLFVERLVSNVWTDLLWSLLGLSLFSYWFTLNQNSTAGFYKGARNLVIFAGLFGSAMYGYQSLFSGHNLSVSGTVTKVQKLQFSRVKNLDDFQQKLAAANSQGKSVMVDLYADWCVACKEFEKTTFTDTAVHQALDNTVLLQIDLTDNTPTNLAFQQHFSILGLPTILFFDPQGKELTSARVTGYMPAKRFAGHINQLFNNK